MDKQKAEHLTKQIPGAIKNAVGYIKKNFDENGQEILENTSGTLGLFINLLGKPLLDKYFDKLAEKKLDNLGFQTYLKASFTQVQSSIQVVENSLKDSLDPEGVVKTLLEALASEAEQYKKEDVVLLFRPVYHPMIVRIRDAVASALQGLSSERDVSSRFNRDFNKNIHQSINEAFGEEYDTHQREIKEYLLEENESQLLYETIQGARIGFKEGEDLLYQETYGHWTPITSLHQMDKDKVEKGQLNLVDELIEQYFHDDDHLSKILFLIADFGKGKSVFMRNYAAKMARDYISTQSGLFPIYFNLRDFKNFSSVSKLGVLDDFLQKKYHLKIEDAHFQKKKYVFLFDSLDESGELTQHAIEEVIRSVKAIQDLDPTESFDNRLIVTSRPIGDGLEWQMKRHSPYEIPNEEGTNIPQYISVYGFTPSQFNEWIAQTLRTSTDLKNLEKNTLGKKIKKALEAGELDLHKELLESKTLSESELRRPIFAYMIYQLVLHSVDFLKIGKIGVYLSFLNLLTREAKPYYDKDYQVDLGKELEFRKLLHAIAGLWTLERQSGRQGLLKKADICRAIKGKLIHKEDDKVLEQNKGSDAVDIHFLSHSYFGENQNELHFQHQSFAEILLAEYYLKVFLKFALDEERDIDQVRAKLLIGKPTDQTIEFLKEMLVLFRDVSGSKATTDVIEKRRLLFPLVASLTLTKDNPFYCASLDYQWYQQIKIDEYTKVPPKELLKQWPINEEVIQEVVELAADILKSKTTMLQTEADPKTSLYHHELISLGDKTLNQVMNPMDKWLALLVGNTLFNDEENRQFFNRELKIPYRSILNLIEGYNYAYESACPEWAIGCFLGIDFSSENENTIEYKNLSRLDFSFGYFNHVSIKNCVVAGANFSNCKFYNSDIYHCNIEASILKDLVIENDEDELFAIQFSLINCSIGNGLLFPKLLSDQLGESDIFFTDNRPRKTRIEINDNFTSFSISNFRRLSGVFSHLIHHRNISVEKILGAFVFSGTVGPQLKKNFEDFLRKI
ncbi:MAG: NACHT domain-containing protein [Cytophagales bacterium]|nr:NACHT domain-containing protein [Cytophagales bacterium]